MDFVDAEASGEETSRDLAAMDATERPDEATT